MKFHHHLLGGPCRVHMDSCVCVCGKVRRWVGDAMATGVDEQVQRRLVEEAAVAHGLLAAL